jgi:hypothetical protein
VTQPWKNNEKGKKTFLRKATKMNFSNVSRDTAIIKTNPLVNYLL